MSGLKGDFDKINQVLVELVGGVQRELAEIWPLVGWLNRYLGSVEKVIINFSMEESREAAWSFAETLAPLSDAQRKIKIKGKSRNCFILKSDCSSWICWVISHHIDSFG